MVVDNKTNLEKKLDQVHENNKNIMQDLKSLKESIRQQRVLWMLLIYSIIGVGLTFYLGLGQIEDGIAQIRNV